MDKVLLQDVIDRMTNPKLKEKYEEELRKLNKKFQVKIIDLNGYRTIISAAKSR